MNTVVIDLGGTHLRVALSIGSASLAEIRRTRLPSLMEGASPAMISDYVVDYVVNYIASVDGKLAPGDPVVLAFPGPVQNHTTILNAPTVFGSSTEFPDILGQLRKHTKRQVYVLNDVSAAAWYFSTVIAATRIFVVTISSGVGSKLFDKSHPDGVIDSPAYAGEIGHCVVDDSPTAPDCDCGGKGHLGAIASGRGIERMARLSAQRQPEAFRSSLCSLRLGGTPTTLTNELHIVPAALAGDPWVLGIIQECTVPLARALLTVLVSIGVEKIVIMGGFALSLGNVYVSICSDLLFRFSRYSVLADVLPSVLVLGHMEQEACLQGCAKYSNLLRAHK